MTCGFLKMAASSIGSHEDLDTGEENGGTQGNMGVPAKEGDIPQLKHVQITNRTFKKKYTKTFWHNVFNNPERKENFAYLTQEGHVTLAIDFGA